MILGGELKLNGSSISISRLLTCVSFKSTKIIGLSAIELETFDNVLFLKTMLLTSIWIFNTCLQKFHLGPNYNYRSVELKLNRWHYTKCHDYIYIGYEIDIHSYFYQQTHNLHLEFGLLCTWKHSIVSHIF